MVERDTENVGVGGSIPSLNTNPVTWVSGEAVRAAGKTGNTKVKL